MLKKQRKLEHPRGNDAKLQTAAQAVRKRAARGKAADARLCAADAKVAALKTQLADAEREQQAALEGVKVHYADSTIHMDRTQSVFSWDAYYVDVEGSADVGSGDDGSDTDGDDEWHLWY